jgi:acid phosphatase
MGIWLTPASPAIVYNSIADNKDRLAKIKNTTLFYEELAKNELPQWLFITPNMLHDGHDTNVTYAASWLSSFLTPLLSNKNFMDNTLIHITFDENESYAERNYVYTLLLGDAIPKELVGTTDDNFYDHYSELSTVEANWDLYTLGRWDVGANVFANVAAHTGDKLRKWTADLDDGIQDFSKYYFNSSYPGIFNSVKWARQPVPDIHSRRNGRTTLPSIQAAWPGSDDLNYYHGQLEIPDGAHPPPSTPSP